MLHSGRLLPSQKALDLDLSVGKGVNLVCHFYIIGLQLIIRQTFHIDQIVGNVISLTFYFKLQ